MPKLVDLRQDRNLIRNNFDGYKLSLDSIPIIRQDLIVPPLRATPSDDQYSYLHAELFSLQNLLISDPWDRVSSYYVNHHHEIIKCSYDENNGRPKSLVPVFRIPIVHQRVGGDYNCSIKLISEKFAVLCDGVQELYIIDTGDRQKSAEWKKIASFTISSGERNFALFDSRLDMVNGKKVISCALVRIAKDEFSHCLNMHWATLEQHEKDPWTFEIHDIVEGKGSLYYCAFEPKAECIVMSSNRPLKFKSETGSVVDVESSPKEQNGDCTYTWTQTDDDITVNFRSESEDPDYKIKSSKNSLKVECNGNCLLDQTLFSMVDESLTTWTTKDKILQITLVKEDSSTVWPYLVEGGPPEALESNETNIPLENQPIPNLEAPIEDCDFPMGTQDNEIKIERLHLGSKTATHQILLDNSPPLFSTNLRPGFPLALATRQDVDTCLWLQQYNPNKTSEWGFRHEGNLHAFGYVQASKQQKKFMDCAPDLSYAVICESHRHVFLYKSNNDTADGLRNRCGSQVSLGKQHLITLEDTGEVLGISTHSCVITLLTEKCVLFLQIN
ncbi:nudC domain-containing protein 1 [Episyrphus balteatus]|uniref:nudC domain-containing protein 1 n=1 Tax=Episyrphus balteatus TaxID=286459 RepID=UPI0024856466|nr:nudC domain-containing protein 1 [Episyrphus balteatus]